MSCVKLKGFPMLFAIITLGIMDKDVSMQIPRDDPKSLNCQTIPEYPRSPLTTNTLSVSELGG